MKILKMEAGFYVLCVYDRDRPKAWIGDRLDRYAWGMNVKLNYQENYYMSRWESYEVDEWHRSFMAVKERNAIDREIAKPVQGKEIKKCRL